MQSGQKQIVLGKEERERKKERKDKKKKEKRKKKRKIEKKKRKKKKGEKKGWGNQSEIKKKKKKHGGVSSDSVYFKSLDFPWNLSVWLVPGGGACCVDFQVLALGGAALPLPGAQWGLFTP